MMNKLGDKKIKTIITSIYVFNRFFIQMLLFENFSNFGDSIKDWNNKKYEF